MYKDRTVKFVINNVIEAVVASVHFGYFSIFSISLVVAVRKCFSILVIVMFVLMFLFIAIFSNILIAIEQPIT